MKNPYLPYPVRIDEIITETEDRNLKTFKFVFINQGDEERFSYTPGQFAEFADQVRERTGGIPVGFKLSAQHIEDDLEAALEVGVDYVILDGRGGGTGAAPLLFTTTSRCRRSPPWLGRGGSSTDQAPTESR